MRIRMPPSALLDRTRCSLLVADLAAEHHRLDVARMTLQTLVNTYPDSEYAAEAKRVLNDPRLQGCGSSDGMQFSESAFSPCGSMPGVVDGEQPLFFGSDRTLSGETPE
jgi:hypothetical protein